MNTLKNEILKSADKIKEQIITDRRTLHKNPEVGFTLPQTTQYVKNRLIKMGYEPKEIIQSGIVAQIAGKNDGACVLLRADMDALNICEKTGLDFSSQNKSMHACGHDMHTAMLLGAAELLKKYQNEINGSVKLVFQPNEEGFGGARSMIDAGVLTNPRPSVALALHVHSQTPTNTVICAKGLLMASCTIFRITIVGIGCHGSMPESGIDPINVATHIYLALQGLVTREIAAKTPVIITVGKFCGGDMANVIPGTAVMEGTIRTFDEELSKKIMERIKQIAQAVATAFCASAKTELVAYAPPLKNDDNFINAALQYSIELFGKDSVLTIDEGAMGSEDFAYYCKEVPCAYLMIGAEMKKENETAGRPMHNEEVMFDEKALPFGAALYAYQAIRLLYDAK